MGEKKRRKIPKDAAYSDSVTKRIDRRTNSEVTQGQALDLSVAPFLACRCSVGQNNPGNRLEYWATRSSVRSFACTAHFFACSGLLASLAPSAALNRSLARSLRLLPNSWDSD